MFARTKKSGKYHRIMASGSDRFCDKWHRDYVVKGADEIALHHLYRAMAFIGEEIEDQANATPFAPRCTKDVVEERLFLLNRHLFSGHDGGKPIRRTSGLRRISNFSFTFR